jgi:hypothetical protein
MPPLAWTDRISDRPSWDLRALPLASGNWPRRSVVEFPHFRPTKMTSNDGKGIANRARAEMEQIERAATRDQPGWTGYLANLSEQGREIAMGAATDRTTFDRWRVLKMVAAEPDKQK